VRNRFGIMVSMNRLSGEKREQVIRCLVEGMSIRATVRTTGVAKNTVVKLLSDLGLVCSIYQDRLLRDLPCTRIQCDEIWTFVGCKEKNVTPDKKGEQGDIWTWVALDPDTKLVPTYLVGGRTLYEARTFMHDLAKRLRYRVQLSTDGYNAYASAVKEAFPDGVDYAQVVKVYAAKGDGRYSPARLIDTDVNVMSGTPDPDHISTSYVERQNLTIRMSMRRYTRLTNAFSRKVENHVAAVSIHFFYYNFCRVHASLKGKTPAMAAGVTDRVWKVSDLIQLLSDAENAVPMKRGPYKKREAA
jgi:IS1 family transposase